MTMPLAPAMESGPATGRLNKKPETPSQPHEGQSPVRLPSQIATRSKAHRQTL